MSKGTLELRLYRGAFTECTELPLRIYNTASRSIEKLALLESGKARGYVCGPTPYDSMHVGHARTYSFFDTFVKLLRYLGVKVDLVINFTDIDDKIVNKAREEFGPESYRRWREIPERYIREFFEVSSRLNIDPATHYPRVTDHVEDMVSSIEKLVSSGYAYVAPDGSVYFDVTKVPNYGAFSRQDISSLIAGARVEPEPGKRNPLDFALWKSWKPGEPWWPSPWCPGRPGWHLECVVMAAKYLGVPFDFHGGGLDLVFPHHENEIAIARALFGKSILARYWVHVGLVTVHGEKMSKSLKNIVTVQEVLSRHSGEALRLYYSMTHYRKPLDFSLEGLQQAEQLLRTLYAAHDYLLQLTREARDEQGEKDSEVLTRCYYFENQFIEKLLDDMDTPGAVSTIIEFARYITSTLIYVPEKVSKTTCTTLLQIYTELGNILGVLYQTKLPDIVIELVEEIVKVRSRLRSEKKYDLADGIRAFLTNMGIYLTDTRVRTYWTIDRTRVNLPT